MQFYKVDIISTFFMLKLIVGDNMDNNNEGKTNKIKYYVNKTFSMFSSMNMKQLLGMFAVIIFVMLALSLITNGMDAYKEKLIMLLVSKFTDELQELYTFIITEVFDLFVFVGAILILISVFKGLYLDNYTGEIKDFFNHSNNETPVTITPNINTIENNEEANEFMAIMVKIFVKIVFFIPFITVTLMFSGLLAACIYLITLVKYGLLFIGLAIVLLGFALNVYMFVRLFWTIEIGTKVRPFLILVCFILSMVIIPAGTTVTFIELASIESKEYDHSSDSTDIILLNYNKLLYIKEVSTNSSTITMNIDNTMTDKVEVKVTYDNRVFDVFVGIDEDNNSINIVPNSKLGNVYDTLDFILECIKRKSFMGAGSYSIEIKSSEENIKTIIKNTSDKYLTEITKEDNKYLLDIKGNYKDNLICEDKEYYKECVMIYNSTVALESSDFKYENDTLVYDTNKYTCVINNPNQFTPLYFCDLVS